MASVDSGVDTGNDSNDSFAQDKNSVTQNEIQPNSSCGSSVVNADFVATSDGKVNKQCILRFKPLHIDPPAGLSFLNVQPISLSRGYEVAFQRFNAEYQRSRLINKMKHDHLKSLKHLNICQSDRFMPTRRHIFRRGKTWIDFTRQRDENRLRLAAFMNDANKVREFLEAGVDPNCPDYQFRTPLHLSACNGYTEIVGLLLEHGADPNVKDMVGNTPLHLAVCTNHIDVVTLLLKGVSMKICKVEKHLDEFDFKNFFKSFEIYVRDSDYTIDKIKFLCFLNKFLFQGTDASCYNVTGRSPLQLAQSKLKIIQRCEDSEYKHQVTSQVIEMLLTFIKKKTEVSKNAVDEELLNAFQSRLQVSETQEQVENELQNLLDNLSSLSLTNSPTSTITTNDQSAVSTISTITPSI